MSKYLTLNFRGAKLFRKFNKDKVNRRCKDFSFDVITGKYKSRDFLSSFVEPITVHQVSNMLHVLFNERPVPSLRRCLYYRIDHYFDMAQNSYLKIDTPKINESRNDFYYETTHVKKGVHDAWNPAPQVNWEVARNYIDDKEKLKVFINKLNEILNINSELLSFLTIRDMVFKLSTEKRVELYDTIIELKNITAMVDYFGSYKGNGEFNNPVDSSITRRNNKMARLVNMGLETVVSLSGQIIVPVLDEDIEKLRTSSKGCATILDGGLVWIDSIKDGANISVENFIQVKEISDEKTKPALCE